MPFANNSLLPKMLFACLVMSLMLCLSGCIGEAAPATESDSSVQSTDDFSNNTEDDSSLDDTVEIIEYFEIKNDGGTYSYTLFNKDMSVAEKMDGCTSAPEITQCTENLIRVTIEDETYYYDLDGRVFSDTFEYVYSENGTLLIRAERDKVVICDIFDPDGFYTEISEFSHGLSYACEYPIIDAGFVDGGSAVSIVYLSGIEMATMNECFNISNGSRFVIVNDWRNQKDLVSSDEKSYVENYLYTYLGRIEPNTGFSYIYTITGSLEINGEKYYYCDCSWIMVGEDGSETEAPVSTFVVSESMTKVYDCREDDGDLKIFTEDNMI